MKDPSGSGGALTPRLTALFVSGYLLIQVAIPVVQLSKPRPAQFGWQMFSGIQSMPRLEVFTTDSSYAVEFDSVALKGRSDVRYDERLRDWLCQSYNAERVRIYREFPSRDRTMTCGR